MPFTGIPFAALDFYEDLEADNSRVYWLAHKEIYDEQVKAPITELVAELTHTWGPGKFFRPYRDVRFAKDKTPYKDHQGVYFGETRRYFHISASGLYIGGGMFGWESDQVARYRRAVADDVAGRALVIAVAHAEKAKLVVGGQRLTRVPSGFAKDHERADLLRHKSLTASREYGSPEWLKTARAKTEIVKGWRAMQPMIDWLDTHVGNSDKPLEQRR